MKRVILMACMLLAVLGAHAEAWINIEEDGGTVWSVDVDFLQYYNDMPVIRVKYEYDKPKQLDVTYDSSIGNIVYNGDEYACLRLDVYNSGRFVKSYYYDEPTWFAAPEGSIIQACYDTVHIFVGETSDVYVCTGKSATKYHISSDCRGLSRCQGDIIKISVSEAEEYGYGPCKLCY